MSKIKSTLVLVAGLALISLNTVRSQVSLGENGNADCLEMVIDEINKDLKFLIENPEGNDSAIYHLTRLRNRILAKMDKPKERPGNRKQDSIIRSNIKASIQFKVNELTRERERILKSSSETNPVIINLDKQIENLDKQLEKLEQSKRNKN